MADQGHRGVSVGRAFRAKDDLEQVSKYIYWEAGYAEWEWGEASWRQSHHPMIKNQSYVSG